MPFFYKIIFAAIKRKKIFFFLYIEKDYIWNVSEEEGRNKGGKGDRTIEGYEFKKKKKNEEKICDFQLLFIAFSLKFFFIYYIEKKKKVFFIYF